MRYLIISCFAALLSHISYGQWTPFCSGTSNGYIVELEVYDDTLYAVGFPTQICGASVQRIGAYDGMSWTALGGGHSEALNAVERIGGTMYMAPYLFSNSGNHIRRLVNGSWQTMGDAISCTYFNGLDATPSLYDVVEYNGDIISSGEFDRLGTDTVNCIMRWDGNAWQAMGSGLTGSTQNGSQNVRFPHDLYVWNGQLLATGNFEMAGGVVCNGIASWDGTQWSAMGAGFDNTVYSVMEYNGELYACGAFSASGSTPIEKVAKWNGSDWIAAEFGIPGNEDLLYGRW